MNPTQERRQEDRRNLLAADASVAHMQRKAAEERAAKAEAERDELLAACRSFVGLVEEHADFDNGVTDPTGSINEGRIRGGQAIDEFHAAIAKAAGSAA